VPLDGLNYGNSPIQFPNISLLALQDDAYVNTQNLIIMKCQWDTFYNLSSNTSLISNTNNRFIQTGSQLATTNSLPSVTLCPTGAPTVSKYPQINQR